MPLNRIACPECGAGLKSKTGFTPGETVCCPKCETYFSVEEPQDGDEEEKPTKDRAAAKGGAKKPVRAAAADDDEDEGKPKKKKKKRDDDDEADEEEWSYKNSWIRYAVLGVLLIVLAVLGYLLYEKRQREADANAAVGRGGAPANTG